MIFSLLIIHKHDRMSSISRVLHAATWVYFTSRLPYRFSRSPKAVKEAIMTDINDLVQEFWRTSSDGVVGPSFFAMRRLLKILQGCFDISEVCFDIISAFVTAVDLADKNLQRLANLDSWDYSAQSDPDDTEFRAKFKIMFDGYRKMSDQSLSKSEDIMLRFLPGVLVQSGMSKQGMADLYMSGFLQDRDQSQLYFSDPMLQHISICRHFLSLLDRSNIIQVEFHS